ncbi:MAG: RNA methyltransferase substrate-binding domain-containing protein, partial [Bacteroidota bacterium]
MNTEHDHFIYGTRAVIEALNAGKTLDRIWIQKGLSNTLYHELRQALKGLQIPLLT